MSKSIATNRLLYTVAEAAETLGISRSHMYAALNRGELPVVRLGRTARVPRLWLERWIAEQTERWEAANGR
jgi:excisionase family DNA binding protein